MKTKVYNLEGKTAGEMELSDAVFGVAVKPAVVHEVYSAQLANQRQPWADTQGKGDVRGGGKKPWAQKGTGRARHGSIRSPIWKGGGVVFGPKTERNFKMKINKQTRRAAIKMCLSDKVAGEHFLVVEDFSFAQPKTKLFAQLLKVLPVSFKKYLVLIPDKNETVIQMTKNMPAVATARAQDVTVTDLLACDGVLTTKMGVEKITAVLTKK